MCRFSRIRALKRWTLFIGVCCWSMLCCGHAAADRSVTVSLYQGVSLSDGMTCFDPTVLTVMVGQPEEIAAISAPPVAPLFEFPTPIDFFFQLTADASTPLEMVFTEQIQAVALMTTDNPDDFRWWYSPYQVAFAPGDTLVVRLDDDSMLLLDDIVWQAETLTFTVRPLTPQPTPTPGPTATPTPITPGGVPEPSTLALLGVGLFGGIAALRRKQGRRVLSLFTLLTVMGMSDHAFAAELRVMTIGSGMGTVTGEGIFCGITCTKEYPEHTLVQLKAEPFPNSRFVEWRVNGQPHEGILIIERNTLVQAIFESTLPEEPQVIFWYDEDSIYKASLALDQIVVFFDEKKFDRTIIERAIQSKEELLQLLQNISTRFAPKAEILEYDSLGMLLQLPEPITREELERKFATFEPTDFISSLGIVVYSNRETLLGRMFFSGIIDVAYAEGITDEQIADIEQQYGLQRVKEIPNIGVFVYKTNTNPIEAITVANRLYESGYVEYASPSWSKRGSLHSFCPNEGMFLQQWHLSNRIYSNYSNLNILPAWEMSKGEGIVVGIVDTGVDYTHLDLKTHYRKDLSYDFRDMDDDPFPRKKPLVDLGHFDLEEWKTESHGTNVAGLAVATGGLGFSGEDAQGGVCGTAPDAYLAALRLTFYSDFDKDAFMKDWAAALMFEKNKIDIYNSSLGIITNKTKGLLNRAAIIIRALKYGIGSDSEGNLVNGRGGRYGKGNLYVISAGNEGIFASNDAILNSRFVIPIAASNESDQHPNYSNQGAFILVNAPSGGDNYNNIVTSDYYLSTYTPDFGGTSASAPMVSGVIALMLKEKRELTWRDVRHILIKTARKNDPGDSSWNTKGVYPYSHEYGFGSVDATAAVEAAKSWELIPEEIKIGPYPSKTDILNVPRNIQIEFVEVIFTSNYTPWQELNIRLLSPNNTESILAKSPNIIESEGTYQNWTFGSVRHFGEPSAGKWQLLVTDIYGKSVKNFTWQLKIYGAKFPLGLPFTGVYGMKDQGLYWEPQTIPTSDGGYLTVVGIYGPGTLLVIKLDSAGGVEWAKTLDGNADESQLSLVSVGTYRASEAALTAFSQAGFADAAAALRIALGSKTYASPSLFMHLARQVVLPFGEEALAALPVFLHRALTETGWVFAGVTGLFGASKGMAWVVKFDTTGKIVWQDAYDLLPDCKENCSIEQPSAIHPTNDGGLLLSGSSSSRGWLLKLDANGVPVWQISNEEAIAFNDVVETNDNRLVVTGAGYGLVVGVFDASSGTAQYAFQYPIAGYYASGYHLILADDGGFLVQGVTMGSGMWGFREWDVVAAKFDAALQPRWINQYGVPDFDEAHTLLPSGENGALIGGGLCVNRNFGNMCVGTQSAWWLRLDEDGQVIGSQTRADAAYGPIFSFAHTGDGGYVAAGPHYTSQYGRRIFVAKTGGADALFAQPDASCVDAGNTPDVQARPVATAPVPLELHVQYATSIPFFNTASHTVIEDALSSLAFEVDLCLPEL